MTEEILQHLKQSSVPLLVIGDVLIDEIKAGLNISESDFLLIESNEEEETIKIEKTKDAIHFVILRPYNSQLKLVVFDSADKMTPEAANNLLKTLEEPPAYGRIILVTKKEKLILPTIVSRCRKINITKAKEINPPENYLSPEEISSKTITEKFAYVGEIAESNNLELILTCWQQYYRDKMLAGENTVEVLKEISRAKDLLLTNISLKLLLENLVLDF